MEALHFALESTARLDVSDLDDAGELNPTEAGERFERAVQKIVPPTDKPARDS